MDFSFIVPVYNRSDELDELLESFARQPDKNLFTYEIIVADDGSEEDLKPIVKKYENTLPVHYFKKNNTGPGDTRNQAMKRASGNYFVILDSDVILPENYFEKLYRLYQTGKLKDLGGGPDKAKKDFSPLQKAIDLTMTAFFSTGGIRGSKRKVTKFVPRSFNMIVHRKVFEETGGFGNMHPGEDPEWVYRAWKMGFESRFYPELYVFHKRRITLKSFFNQIKKFGKARYVLNLLYPGFRSPVFLFPLVYTLGLLFALIGLWFNFYIILVLYFMYGFLLITEFWIKSKSIKISLLAFIVFQIQMIAYATGYIKAALKVRSDPENLSRKIPELFFKLKKEKPEHERNF